MPYGTTLFWEGARIILFRAPSYTGFLERPMIEQYHNDIMYSIAVNPAFVCYHFFVRRTIYILVRRDRVPLAILWVNPHLPVECAHTHTYLAYPELHSYAP